MDGCGCSLGHMVSVGLGGTGGAALDGTGGAALSGTGGAVFDATRLWWGAGAEEFRCLALFLTFLRLVDLRGNLSKSDNWKTQSGGSSK